MLYSAKYSNKLFLGFSEGTSRINLSQPQFTINKMKSIKIPQQGIMTMKKNSHYRSYGYNSYQWLRKAHEEIKKYLLRVQFENTIVNAMWSHLLNNKYEKEY